MRWDGIGALAVAALLCAGHAAGAETIKVGMLREGALTAPIFIAKEKGYFAAQGLDCEIVNFDAALPVAMGVVSGDVDFAVNGITAGFYKLASQGALKIIAGYGSEAPTFHAQAVVASKSAYAAGLTGVAMLKDHSVAVSQVGGSTHYSLGLLAQKYHFDIKSIQLQPLQSNPNSATAVAGGRVDAGVIPGRYVLPAIDHGDIKLLAWVGDEVSWQLGATITHTKKLRDNPDEVRRFLIAYRQGVRDYHDAFTGPGEKRLDGPTAPEMLAIIAKYTGMDTASLDASIGYIDRDARLDVADIGRQIAWYKAQNLLTGDVTGEMLIDAKSVEPMPQNARAPQN